MSSMAELAGHPSIINGELNCRSNKRNKHIYSLSLDSEYIRSLY